jgi:hypothetical protein
MLDRLSRAAQKRERSWRLNDQKPRRYSLHRRLPFMALFGHAAISELSLLLGVKRKLDFESAKGRFWRKGVVRHRDRRVPTVEVGALLVGRPEISRIGILKI